MGLTCPLFFVNWICAINDINTDGVACDLCGRAWVRGLCRQRAHIRLGSQSRVSSSPHWSSARSSAQCYLIWPWIPSLLRLAPVSFFCIDLASLEHCGLIRPVSVASLTFSRLAGHLRFWNRILLHRQVEVAHLEGFHLIRVWTAPRHPLRHWSRGGAFASLIIGPACLFPLGFPVAGGSSARSTEPGFGLVTVLGLLVGFRIVANTDGWILLSLGCQVILLSLTSAYLCCGACPN